MQDICQGRVEICTDMPKLPHSALMIYFALRDAETCCTGLKPGDISKKTNLRPRTVRYGLRILVKQEIIGKIPDLKDLRSHYYRLLRKTSNSMELFQG